MKKLVSRTTTLVVAAALSAVALLGFAAPAQAESPILGTVALTPASGGVADTPFVTSATTSAPCPSGYSDFVSLRVGPVGGPYTLLGRVGSTGGYDTAPVALAASRSLTTALGGTPSDGDYEVIINCADDLNGTAARVFSNYITVTGAQWSVKPAAATATKLTVKPYPIVRVGKTVTLTAKVSAAAAAGTAEFFDGATSLGTVTVTGGVATFATSSLTAGQHQLSVAFTPDDVRLFAPSTSQTVCLYVIG